MWKDKVGQLSAGRHTYTELRPRSFKENGPVPDWNIEWRQNVEISNGEKCRDQKVRAVSLFLLLLFYQVNFLLLFSVFLLLSMHTHSSLCVSVCQPFKKENPSNSRRRLLGTVAVARNYLQSAMGRECVAVCALAPLSITTHLCIA